MAELLYKLEVYEIIGVCMEVHNVLGFGFSEVVYKDAMQIEFELREMVHQREKAFAIIYKGRALKRTFNADFTVFEKIILEVKTNRDGISNDDIAQVINYLKASGLRLGLLINFGKRKLEYKRIVL